jgi:hypothetical protein
VSVAVSQDQGGCGQRFEWKDAPVYTPPATLHLELPTFQEQVPRKAIRYRPMLGHGEAVRCDGCRKVVVGPVAWCIHCPSHARCIKCQLGRHADGKHVFKVDVGMEIKSPPMRRSASQ